MNSDREMEQLWMEDLSQVSWTDRNMINPPKPWKNAMYKVIIGMGITMLTIDVWCWSYIMSAIGVILTFLGMRVLQRENLWFRIGFGLSICHLLVVDTVLIYNAAIWHTTIPELQTMMSGFSYGAIILSFLQFVMLWTGIQAVRKKENREVEYKSLSAFVICYLGMIILSDMDEVGWMVVANVILYLCVIWSLWKQAKELEQDGYDIHFTSLKISQRTVGILLGVMLAAGMAAAYRYGGKYPMNYEAFSCDKSIEIEKVKGKLAALGMPQNIAEELTDEEILSCKDAKMIQVESQKITIEDEPSGKEWDNEENAAMEFTTVAVKLDDSEEQNWKLIHHFQWLMTPKFSGTEAIEVWPTYRSMADQWTNKDSYSGRIYYELGETTYSGDYYTLTQETVASYSIMENSAGMKIFAEFSLPKNSENVRGYVMYDTEGDCKENLLASYMTYIHQQTITYPAITAKEWAVKFNPLFAPENFKDMKHQFLYEEFSYKE